MSLLDDNIEAPRQRSAVLALLALFGLVLTLIGIGGVTAQAVLRRTREIGVRMAFGATPHQVVRTVAGDSLKPALMGLTLGGVAVVYTTGILERYLFETTPTDPLTLLSVGVGVVVMASVAAWLPARRAARIDPVVALRE
jgi:ABC-type antimicrobial peptide transport system permease subunit